MSLKEGIREVGRFGGPVNMVTVSGPNNKPVSYATIGTVELLNVNEPDVQGMLADVLRRDMHERGVDFIQVHTYPDGESEVRWACGDRDGLVYGDDNILEVYIEAWLQAFHELSWEVGKGVH